MMPASAPTAGEVENNQRNEANSIVVVDIDAQVIAALSAMAQESFAGRFTSKAPAADLRIAVGDTLQIAVIEQSPGLFSHSGESTPSGGGAGGIGSTTLLPVIVGRDGMINVPFAGLIPAAGLTVEALRERIERKLADKAVNPQAQVALLSSATVGANSATVGGEVNRSGVIPLRSSGSRLLDVMAEAGGARYPAFETTVHLTRRRLEAAVSLQRVVDRPEENIYIYPGDNIYVSQDPKTFSVLGASSKVGRFPFGSESVNLAEAIAESGGFVDASSDPSGVFIFRYEASSLVRAMRPDAAPAGVDSVPVIYRLNLREGDGYFRARQFAMRDKDIVLVANSDGAQLQKFLGIVSAITGNASNLTSIYLQISPRNGTTPATVITTSTH